MKEARRQKYLTYRDRGIRITLNFSSEAAQARGEWGEVFSVKRKKKKNPPFNAVLLNKYATLNNHN